MAQQIGEPPPSSEPGPVVGIALSGGGVRSAAFSFGALQALQARLGLVHGPGRASFMSAVSGGSYAAAAVLMALRGPVGDEKTEDNEKWLSVPSHDPLRPGSSESDYLRVHARYMLESAPAVTIARFAALIFSSVLTSLSAAAVVGALMRIVARSVSDSWWLLAGLGAGVVLAFIVALVVSTARRNARTRAGDHAGDLEITLYDALVGTAWLAVATAVALLYTLNASAITDGVSRAQLAASTLAVGLVGSSVLGPTLLALVRAQIAPRRDRGSRRSRLASAVRSIGIVLAESALVVLVPLTLIGAFLVGWTGFGDGLSFLGRTSDYARQLSVLVVAGSLVAAMLVLAALGGDKALSPHALYRDRLARAFSFVRQQDPKQPSDVDQATQGGESTWPVRTRARLVQPPLSSLAPSETFQVPELLICASVNVNEPGVAAAGSHARPIVFSPLEIKLAGEPVAKMSTAAYEQVTRRPVRAFRHSFDASVMSYVALTGAAVSPSMGKYTKTWLRSVLTLLNIRLGTWIPNPASKTLEEFAEAGGAVPRLNHCPSPVLWLRELRGRHYLRARHIYVSDGGHYENLGIVELVRRGCTEIWAIDASGDDRGTWGALSESLNLIASELGCEVTGDFEQFAALDEPDGEHRLIRRTFADVHVRGRRDVDGHLVAHHVVIHVVKIGVSPHTNPVVLQLGRKYRKFPYDSTLNQLYTAERFDLYRGLGFDSTARAIRVTTGR